LIKDSLIVKVKYGDFEGAVRKFERAFERSGLGVELKKRRGFIPKGKRNGRRRMTDGK
jgi:ribosomal protein S21